MGLRMVSNIIIKWPLGPGHSKSLTLAAFNGPFMVHRLRGSASPVLTATGFVNGNRPFSTPHRIDTPQPITKKFVTGDYVGDPYGCAKLGAYPYTGSFWAHGWNITKIIFIYAPFLRNSPTGQTRRRIFTHNGSNDADSRKDVPFWEFFTLLSI